MSISHFEIFYNAHRKVNSVRLKDIREDRDITQRDLAEYLHICQNTYSQYETGKHQLPVEILIRLADYFDTSTDYILGLTDEPKPYPHSTRMKLD